MSSEAERLRELEEERFRQRLLAVEREAQRLKTTVRILGIGLVVTLALASAAAFTPHLLEMGGNEVRLDLLRVREIVLENDQGVARGRWLVDGAGNSRMSLLDRQGRPRLGLSVLTGGQPGLALMNANGKSRATLGINPDESATLVFSDGSEVARATLGLSRADDGHLIFADADRAVRVALGLQGSGVATVILPEDLPSSSSGEGGS
jgi:hypothetical protein